jgi:radical SAM protein with 4Fe4S-binding SPASM domain
MCLRTTDMVRPDQLLRLELLTKMHDRGDFSGSYYVELQMAGEPSLHPQLDSIINFLKHVVGVAVGLSTHGLQIRKNEKLAGTLLELDALTISVDSIDPETYHKMRYPGTFKQLLESLDILFGAARKRVKTPFIELQLISTDMFPGTGDVEALQKLMDEKGWNDLFSIRTTGDCFSEMQGRVHAGSRTRNTSLCINPWTSVSVASNGDVVSCCFIFEPDKDTVNWYGNLYEQSLQEIWNGSRVRAMQEMHMKGGSLKDQCAKCYLKSPYLIHQNIISRLIRNQRQRVAI